MELFGESNDRSAVLSPCGTWRYRLDREVAAEGIVIAYFGINPSTADATVEDSTTKKWRGFTVRNGGRKYIAVNPFAFRATNVAELESAADPIGPENDAYISAVIEEADLLVPCWGSRDKLPKALRARLNTLLSMLRKSGKPMRVFGWTKSGDPIHPLMLGYDTQLVSM